MTVSLFSPDEKKCPAIYNVNYYDHTVVLV